MTDMNNCIEIKTKRGDREYVFHVPNNSPWGELFDASFEIHKKVSEMVGEAVKSSIAQEAAPAGDAPKD
jgi:hypothetical protein